MKVIVDNLAIEYSDEGQGPVVVFLHGWQDSLHTFNAIASQLPNYRLIRLDLPGFGGSETPREPWDIDRYVAFTAAFIAKLQLEPDTLIGHSLGGRISIKGVATGTLKPRKLVLIASAGIAKSKSARNQAFKAIAKVGKAATALPPLSRVRQNLRRKLYSTAGSDYLDAGPLKQTFLNVIAEDLQSSARTIQTPTLLIWGDADTETPMADGQRLATLIAGSKLKVIPRADHFVHQASAVEVAKLIRDFIG